MKFLFSLITLLFVGATLCSAKVAVNAPQFQFAGKNGRPTSLSSLKGQPVVLIIAKTPRKRDAKKQIKYLEKLYRQFAGRDVIFAAAFTESADKFKTDIPFVLVQNAPAVAAAYGSDGDFRIAVIGKDGNLDMITAKRVSAERVQSVIDNSYLVQAARRK